MSPETGKTFETDSPAVTPQMASGNIYLPDSDFCRRGRPANVYDPRMVV